MVDVDSLAYEFARIIKQKPTPEIHINHQDNLEILQDPEYRRLGSTVDMEAAAKIFNIPR